MRLSGSSMGKDIVEPFTVTIWRRWGAHIFFSLFAVCLTSPALARDWSVADNIRIDKVAWSSNLSGNVSAQDTQFIYSTDGKYVAFVIERTRPETNSVQSELEIQRVEALRKFAMGGQSPKAVFKAGRSSKINARAIGGLSWSRFEDRLYFIVLDQAGISHVAVWSPDASAISVLSSHRTNVVSYQEVDQNTLLLYVARRTMLGRDETAPNRITGRDLAHVIDPTYGNHVAERSWIYDSKDMLLLNVDTRKIASLGVQSYPLAGASASPTGRYIAFLEPVIGRWWGSCWELETPDKSAEVYDAGRLAIYDRKNQATIHPLSGPTTFHLSPNAIGVAIKWSPDSSRAIVSGAFGGSACPVPAADAFGAYVVGPEPNPTLLMPLKIQSDGMMPNYIADAGWDDNNHPWLTSWHERLSYYGISQVGAEDLPSQTILFSRREDGTYERAGSRGPADKRFAQPGVLSVCEDSNVLPTICTHDSQGLPRTLLDLSSRVRDADIVPFKLIDWKDKAGNAWTGWLALPEHVSGPFPLLLQTHGAALGHQFLAEGATTSGYPGRAAPGAGFAVLHVIEPRLSGSRIEEPMRVLDGYRAIVDKLAAEGIIDKDRVGLVGWSRTAGYVEYILGHAPAFAGAAVIADGLDYGLWQYQSFQEFASGGVTQQYKALYGGDIASHPQEWLSQAPDLQGAHLETPVRIQIHGLDSILEEWGFYTSARAAHIPVELDYYPNSHLLFRPQDRLYSLSGSLDWFRFWLQGYEDPAPDKADQYRRWEGLCDMQVAQKTGQPTFCVPTKH